MCSGAALASSVQKQVKRLLAGSVYGEPGKKLAPGKDGDYVQNKLYGGVAEGRKGRMEHEVENIFSSSWL